MAVLGALVLLGMMPAGPAAAASFTVSSGQTVTTTQTLSNSGDTGTVDAGGTINGGANNAVNMNNTDQTVTNGGTISTTGSSAYGVYSTGNNATITNNGTITTSNTNGFGVDSLGLYATITNNGTISTTGYNGQGLRSGNGYTSMTNNGSISTTGSHSTGIFSYGTNQTITNNGTISTTGDYAEGIKAPGKTITNSGTISTTGGYAYGIDSTGSGATVTNSGTIKTSGIASDGIDSTASGATVTNNGTISTTGKSGYGVYSSGADASITNNGTISTTHSNTDSIFSYGTNATITNSGSISSAGDSSISIRAGGTNAIITNSGTISTSGTNSFGISSTASDATITNSGLISATGTGSSSLNLYGANPHLNLMQGSVVAGTVTITSSAVGTSHLYVGNGLNLMLTTTNPWASVATAGSPYAVSGDEVAVADATPVAQQGANLADLSGGIFDTAFSAMDQGSTGGVTAAVPTQLAMAGAAPADLPVAAARQVRRSRHAWLRVFGGLRARDHGSPHSVDHYAGIMMGADTKPARTRYGAFVGYAVGKLKVGGSTTTVDNRSFFAGAYARHRLGRVTVEASAMAGYATNDQTREVANNSVSGGIQTGTMHGHGAFVGLGVEARRRVPLRDGLSLVPLARVHYTGLFQDKSSESGTAQDLTVDNPDVHLVAGRVQLGLERGRHRAGGTVLTLRTGLTGRTNLGPRNADGTLLGQTIRFSTGQRSVAGAFVGGGVSYDPGDDGVALSFNAELGREFGTAATTFDGVVEASVVF